MKIIFGFIWAISILNGILYGAPVSYLLAMGMMVALLAGNITVCRRHYRRWIDVVTFTLLSIPIFMCITTRASGTSVYCSRCCFPAELYLSWHPQQFCHQSVLSCCGGFVLPVRPECVSGEHLRGKCGFALPYLYICFVLIAYMLMYSIQRYWVEKRRRQEKLEQRVHEEKKKLQECPCV